MKTLFHAIYMGFIGLTIAAAIGMLVLITAKLAFGAEPRSKDNTHYDPFGPNHEINRLYEIFDGLPPREDHPENRRYENYFDEEREQDHYADKDDE